MCREVSVLFLIPRSGLLEQTSTSYNYILITNRTGCSKYDMKQKNSLPRVA
jgi:hypothetical protein